jgi:hypothetical protein
MDTVGGCHSSTETCLTADTSVILVLRKSRRVRVLGPPKDETSVTWAPLISTSSNAGGLASGETSLTGVLLKSMRRRSRRSTRGDRSFNRVRPTSSSCRAVKFAANNILLISVPFKRRRRSSVKVAKFDTFPTGVLLRLRSCSQIRLVKWATSPTFVPLRTRGEINESGCR